MDKEKKMLAASENAKKVLNLGEVNVCIERPIKFGCLSLTKWRMGGKKVTTYEGKRLGVVELIIRRNGREERRFEYGYCTDEKDLIWEVLPKEVADEKKLELISVATQRPTRSDLCPISVRVNKKNGVVCFQYPFVIKSCTTNASDTVTKLYSHLTLWERLVMCFRGVDDDKLELMNKI